ncbi:MAG: ArnT family glycosyltransferase [SAR324 cluster bacterium]
MSSSLHLNPRRALVLVLAVAALASLTSLETAPLIDWDENMQSGVARQVMLSGDVLQLRLNGQPFTEKPPLFFLEMAGVFKLFGVSEVSARMTSAINGLLFLTALFWIARYLMDTEAATLWTLMYASSLLPLVLSRAAIVEHTFNALMALGALCLVAYDESLSRALARGANSAGRGAFARGEHWAWLLAAALALGLAVLAKGPSGGAVPLVAFGAYKAVRRGAPLHLGHWVVCGALALAVALSWYGANYLFHGGVFIKEFARFMGWEFSRRVQGHGGPFYYHWVAALVGLFPWTPLLLLYLLRDVREAVLRNRLGPAWIGLGVGWAGFVLIVFSIVTTKLPHYSSGIYVPLTMLAALALQGVARIRGRIPVWLAAALALYGLLLAAGMAVLPYTMAELAQGVGAGLDPAPAVPATAFVPGAILGAGIVVGAVLLGWGRTLTGVAVTAVTMGAFIVGVWRVHLPLFAEYNQGPVIALMDEAYRNGGELATYKNVSYAVLFYGCRGNDLVTDCRDVDMVGTEKFAGDAARLDTPGQLPLYVITSRVHVAELATEHPQLRLVRSLGELAMYRLPARSELPRRP